LLLACPQLRSDFVGKSYTLWQKGGRADVKKGYGAQTLAISYKPTATSIKCHSRTLTAALPLPDEEVRVAGLGETAANAYTCWAPSAKRESCSHPRCPRCAVAHARLPPLHTTTPVLCTHILTVHTLNPPPSLLLFFPPGVGGEPDAGG
jgi:hypothetical protein